MNWPGAGFPMGVETGAAAPWCLGLTGPVFPYRGGIAQHTTLLHRALRARGCVETVSFRRQYPAWLFPGKSQLEPGGAGHAEEGVQYLLEPFDLRSWVRTLRRFETAGAQAVIIPWWSSFWAPCFGFLASRLERGGTRVVVLCHNAEEHESGRLRSAVARRFLGSRNRFLAQTQADAETLRRLAPGARVAVHPHPAFHQFPEARGLLPRRARLELLFFGFVRAYKGLDLLTDAMSRLDGAHVFLTVAGEWWLKGREQRALRERLGRAANVEVLDRYVPAGEAAELFHRADAVVLPYRSATGSGVVPLAYRYGRPVIAARVAGLEEAVEDGATGRLFAPGDPAALATTIREFSACSPFDPARLRAGAAAMRWEGLADALLELARP
jgi:glycosyltransferase involved in cell wall biosynthesis